MPFDVRCKFHIAVMIFKCINNMLPAYMSNIISFSHNEHYELRSKERKDLIIPKHKTKYMKDSFEYNGSQIWNSLPIYIREKSSLKLFKRNLQILLLNN